MRLSHLSRPAFVALVLYAAALGWLHARGRVGAPGPDDPSTLAPLDAARVRGRVASIPVQKRGRQEFVLETEAVDGRPAPGRVLARLASSEALDWGDQVELRGRLSLPPPAAAPGVHGWRAHLRLQRIHAIVWGTRAEVLEPAPAPERALSGLRRSMLGALERLLGGEEAAVLSGIMLGEKSALPRETHAAFRDAGAIHLLVASGSNVTFVLLLVAGGLARLGAGRTAASAAGLLAAGFYTLVAGADPPLVRAYVMTCAGALGFLLDRDSGVFQGLVLAAWALLLVEPLTLFQPGFQLSFAATLGIVVAVSYWKVPADWPAPARRAAQLALVSASAQAAVSPLIALYFHRLSLAAVVSNLLLVPMAAALMAAGFALYALSLLPWGLPSAAMAAVVGALLTAFRQAVDAFASLPLASVWVAAPSALFLGAYALAALGALAWPDVRSRRAAAAAACLALASLVSALRPRPLEAGLFDKGGAALVRDPSGGLTLVDAGARGEDLAHAVLAQGRRSVDRVVLTGLGPRHTRGLAELAETLPVAEIEAPPGPCGQACAETRRRVTAAGARWSTRWPGETALGEARLASSWDGYSGREDGLSMTLDWRGLTARSEGRGWSFDTIPVDPRRAARVVYDGRHAPRVELSD